MATLSELKDLKDQVTSVLKEMEEIEENSEEVLDEHSDVQEKFAIAKEALEDLLEQIKDETKGSKKTEDEDEEDEDQEDEQSFDDED